MTTYIANFTDTMGNDVEVFGNTLEEVGQELIAAMPAGDDSPTVQVYSESTGYSVGSVRYQDGVLVWRAA